MRTLLAVMAAACFATFAAPAGAAEKTVWLCNPSQATDPCRQNLTATVLAPDGAMLGTERTRIAKRPPIDCFYVYPTVSEQKTPTADLTIEPQQRSIALYQASRFASLCRVYAPMYRQLTLQGIGDTTKVTDAMRQRAYADVRQAWRSYLRKDNKGRGVVLIGHSQGTFVLRQLAAEEIDPKPSVRKRLVSALLIGGNVTVAKGKDTGGDFKNIPACRAGDQTGCVIAYSLFNDVVPPNSIFGRVANDKLEVLCTNPAALGGGRGKLDSYQPTEPFPGTLGLGVQILQGNEPLPTVSTPWISYPKAYVAHCDLADGADVLQVKGGPGARVLHASPTATWGLHLADMNLPLGNLVAIVKRQTRAYLGG